MHSLNLSLWTLRKDRLPEDLENCLDNEDFTQVLLLYCEALEREESGFIKD